MAEGTGWRAKCKVQKGGRGYWVRCGGSAVQDCLSQTVACQVSDGAAGKTNTQSHTHTNVSAVTHEQFVAIISRINEMHFMAT